MLNIICKNLINICCYFSFLKLTCAWLDKSPRRTHSFVTLLVMLAVTLSNQGRLLACGSSYGPSVADQARVTLFAQIVHSKSCRSCETKPHHTHTHTQKKHSRGPTITTKANHERRVCLLSLLFAHHHYYHYHYHHCCPSSSSLSMGMRVEMGCGSELRDFFRLI